MTNCQKMSGLSGLQTVKEGDSYKAAELLYQTRVGSAFAFIWQRRVYLHFKQGSGPCDWHRNGSQKKKKKRSAAFFLSHNSPGYSQFTLVSGAKVPCISWKIRNGQREKPAERFRFLSRASDGSSSSSMEKQLVEKWKYSRLPRDSFKWLIHLNAF